MEGEKYCMRLYFYLKKLFQRYFTSFQKKILWSFLLTSIIPLISLSVLSYFLSYNIAKNKIFDSISYSSNQLNVILSNRFEQMKNASSLIQNYLYPLVIQPPQKLSDQLESYSTVRNNIIYLKEAYLLDNITIYINPQFLFSDEGITFFPTSELHKRGINEQQLSINTNKLEWILSENINEPFVVNQSYQKKRYLTCFITYQKKDTKTIDYAIFLDLDAQEVNQLLDESSTDASINSYLIDQNGIILAHNNSKLIGQQMKKKIFNKIATNEGPFKIKNNQYIFKRNEITGWYIVTEVPTSYIVKNTIVLISILISAVILVIIISIVSSLFISKELSKKIRTIAKTIKSISLDNNNLISVKLPIDKEKEFKDEFDSLAITFNNMTESINTNFNAILNFKIQEEKMKYQLEQSKINPHFLYNMLDSIKTCQTLGRIDDANKMISQLAHFYRMILKKGDELILIKDELEIAQVYLQLEKLNKSMEFHWKIEKEEGIENFLIPKFVLQPILENCIHHGINNVNTPLFIQISITYKNDAIQFTIQDNGRGITDEKIETLCQVLNNNAFRTNHFGLSNVNYRLSLYSSEKPTIQISRLHPQGTLVSFTIHQMISEELFFEELGG